MRPLVLRFGRDCEMTLQRCEAFRPLETSKFDWDWPVADALAEIEMAVGFLKAMLGRSYEDGDEGFARRLCTEIGLLAAIIHDKNSKVALGIGID